MKKRAFIAGSLAVAAAVSSVTAQQKAVTFLCLPTQEWCQIIANAYKAKTGTEAKFVRLSTGEGIARLRAEKANPGFDVIFGGTADAHEVPANEGLSVFYKPKAWDDIYPNLKKEVKEKYIPLYTGALGWAINDSVLTARKVPAPKTWTDLGDPKYRGLIAMPNANTSGTAYQVITTLVTIYGEDGAFDLLKKIHKNVPRNGYTRPGAGSAFLAARGEVAIGLTFMHDAVAQNVKGFPVRAQAPTDGTSTEIGGISLIKGAPNPDGGKDFIDFALEPATQKLAETADAFQIQSNKKTPISKNAIDFDTIKLIDYDYAKWGNGATRDRLVKRWTSEVFPLPR
jgi:iron(III) transport system substrate-binding protein